jgi:hypothetical protein
MKLTEEQIAFYRSKFEELRSGHTPEVQEVFWDGFIDQAPTVEVFEHDVYSTAPDQVGAPPRTGQFVRLIDYVGLLLAVREQGLVRE